MSAKTNKQHRKLLNRFRLDKILFLENKYLFK